jgi:hypothetical protein
LIAGAECTQQKTYEKRFCYTFSMFKVHYEFEENVWLLQRPDSAAKKIKPKMIFLAFAVRCASGNLNARAVGNVMTAKHLNISLQVVARFGTRLV